MESTRPENHLSSRSQRLVLVVIAVAALVFLSTGQVWAFLPVGSNLAATGPSTLTVTPNPVITCTNGVPGSGVAQVSWHVGAGTDGEVTVSDNSGAETHFAYGSDGTNQPFTAFSGHTYTFYLYGDHTQTTVITSVVVTTQDCNPQTQTVSAQNKTSVAFTLTSSALTQNAPVTPELGLPLMYATGLAGITLTWARSRLKKKK